MLRCVIVLSFCLAWLIPSPLAAAAADQGATPLETIRDFHKSLQHTGAPPARYIAIGDLPAGRMPATQDSINLMKLRFEPDSLDEEKLLFMAANQVRAQQAYAKDAAIPAIQLPACIGLRRVTDLDQSDETQARNQLVAVFTPAEIKNRDPQFAARNLKNEMRTALIELAAQVEPEFGNTLPIQLDYDDGAGELLINVIQMRSMADSTGTKLPPDARGRAAYRVLDRNYGGTRNEYYPLRILLPAYPEPFNIVTVLAFDRVLTDGRFPLPADQAEELLAKRIQWGVVEFTIEKTIDNVALARLEQVVLLSVDNPEGFKLGNMRPVLIVPASAFPLPGTTDFDAGS